MHAVGRRRFLAWTATGAAVTVGGVLAVARASGYSLPPALAQELRVLSVWEFLVVQAVGARLVAPEAADVASTVDALLDELPAADQRDVRRLIGFVEHGAPWLCGHWRRFTSLDARAQDTVLERLERSPLAALHGGFTILKSLAFLALYRQPRTWAALGYDGPVVFFGP